MAFSVMACKEKHDPYQAISSKEIKESGHPGKALMEKNCYLCHNPTTAHDNRIAPPMIAIKKHYITETTTKEEFIKDMQEWIKNPAETNAKMPGAVRKFGVMPKAYYPEESIEKIADYMFDNEIDQPDWFESHFNEEHVKHSGKGHGNNNRMGEGQGKEGKGKRLQKRQGKHSSVSFDHLPPAERGLTYALETKAVLGQNLMGIMKKKGPIAALSFCNERAYPLTDSMATKYNAKIKRVTDKPRNFKNKANAKELVYLERFKAQVKNKEEINPLTDELNDEVHVYYPITTNSMCLKCHGQPQKDIKAETLKKIKELYPRDNATGYNENEVRGMWHVAFNQKAN